mgnify:CR=1 FL=1
MLKVFFSKSGYTCLHSRGRRSQTWTWMSTTPLAALGSKWHEESPSGSWIPFILLPMDQALFWEDATPYHNVHPPAIQRSPAGIWKPNRGYCWISRVWCWWGYPFGSWNRCIWLCLLCDQLPTCSTTSSKKRLKLTGLRNGEQSCRATDLTSFIALVLKTFHLIRYPELLMLPFHLLRVLISFMIHFVIQESPAFTTSWKLETYHILLKMCDRWARLAGYVLKTSPGFTHQFNLT